MKPVERWTKYEQQLWARDQFGFRHFMAPNITPIEHYRPEPPTIGFEAYDNPRPRPKRSKGKSGRSR
jgi:hypothetical protein